MKYLVMECRPAYAVVLGDDGAFRKVANMHYEVGQTVTDVVALNLPEVIEKPVKTNHRRWISSLAAIAACLVLVVTSIFFTGQMPYASVYMTINPEVRIDVNRSDVVVGVEGMNADGTDLLDGYDHRKKDLDTVMDELVDLAIDMGYLHEGGKITLSLDADEEWVTSHGEHLSQHLNEHLTDRITVTIDIEQKQPVQTTPTAPTGTIVIPVGPDNYGESDYGENSTDDGESDYSSSDDGDSNYESPDESQSDYDDGQTDYDDPSDDDGQSEYDNGQSEYGNSQSTYDDPDDDGQSEYEENQSSYDDADDDAGQSDYNTSDDADDGQSDYSQSDDGQSNYDESEDGESNYEDSDEDDDD